MRACLEKVHETLSKHSHLVKQGSVVRILRDAGPGSVEEWVDKDKEMLRNYNGEGGGRFFKWYSRNVFERCIQESQANDSSTSFRRETWTERQVMEALTKTSLRLRLQKEMLPKLRAFEGPQCIAHIVCCRSPPCNNDPKKWRHSGDSCANCKRFHANDASFMSARCESRTQGDSAEGDTWFQCDVCRKSRYVSNESRDALTHDYYYQGMGEVKDKESEVPAFLRWGPFWSEWLTHRMVRERLSRAVGSLGPVDPSPDHHIEGARGDMLSDDGEDDAGASSSGEASMGDEMDAEVRKELDGALASLGARASMTDVEKREAARLAKKERRRASASKPVAVPGTPPQADQNVERQEGWFEETFYAPALSEEDKAKIDFGTFGKVVRFSRRLGRRRDFFNCSMLQAYVEVSDDELPKPSKKWVWKTMTCDDEDDYEALFTRRQDISAYQCGEPVWLLARGLEAVPRQEGAPPFMRPGRVSGRSIYQDDKAVEGCVDVIFPACAALESRLEDEDQSEVALSIASLFG